MLDTPGDNGKPVGGCREGHKLIPEIYERLGLKGVQPAKPRQAVLSTSTGTPAAAAEPDDTRVEITGITKHGLQQALEHLHVEVRWDTRAMRIEITGPRKPGEWYAMDDMHESALAERIKSTCVCHQQAKGEERAAQFGAVTWRRCLEAILNTKRVDPVNAWLDALPPWDGHVRIDSILEELWGCEGPLAAWASQYLILAPVERTKTPGGHLRTIPVLIGGQVAGKSELRALAMSRTRNGSVIRSTSTSARRSASKPAWGS